MSSGQQEQDQYVECEAEEGFGVVPAAAVKTVLRDLISTLSLMQDQQISVAVRNIPAVSDQAVSILSEVEDLEDLGAWVCTFKGDVTVVWPDDYDGQWVCPRCGSTQTVRNDGNTIEDIMSDIAERQSDEARGK